MDDDHVEPFAGAAAADPDNICNSADNFLESGLAFAMPAPRLGGDMAATRTQSGSQNRQELWQRSPDIGEAGQHEDTHRNKDSGTVGGRIAGDGVLASRPSLIPSD